MGFEMTTCALITKPITKMVDDGKSLEDIANSVCPTIKYGKAKIIRIIKDFLGDDYLIQHAETLKYNIEKAQLAKKRKQKPLEKNDAKPDSDSKVKPEDEFDKLVESIQKLIKEYGISEFLEAVEAAQHEET